MEKKTTEDLVKKLSGGALTKEEILERLKRKTMIAEYFLLQLLTQSNKWAQQP